MSHKRDAIRKVAETQIDVPVCGDCGADPFDPKYDSYWKKHGQDMSATIVAYTTITAGAIFGGGPVALATALSIFSERVRNWSPFDVETMLEEKVNFPDDSSSWTNNDDEEICPYCRSDNNLGP